MDSKYPALRNVCGWSGAALIALMMAASPVMAADAISLSAKLNGASETGGGDTDGTGAFAAQLDPETGDLCYTLTAKGIAAPTMAHIHKGAAGADGDVVVKIDITTDGDECVAIQRDLAKAIAAAPSAYYANIHNADFPKGAIRGQLTGPGGAAASAPAPAAEPPAAEAASPAAPAASAPAAAEPAPPAASSALPIP